MGEKNGFVDRYCKNGDSIELHMVEDLNEDICLAKSVLPPDPSRSQICDGFLVMLDRFALQNFM